jgi:hypothetical protein
MNRLRKGWLIGCAVAALMATGGPVPALNLDFTSGTLDSSVTFSRASLATMYDSTGKLTYAPNNLLLQSDDLSNASWTKQLATYDTGTSLLTSTGTSGSYARQLPTLGDNVNYILTCEIKANTAGWVYLFFRPKNGAGGDTSAYFNAATGAVGTKSANNPATHSVASTDGYFRVSMVVNSSSGGTSPITQIQIAEGDTDHVSIANGISLGVRRAQLETVTYETAPRTYNATTAAAFHGPRFDYNPSTLAARGLLIEEARTNLHPNNTFLGGSAGVLPTGWTATGGSGLTVTIGAPQIVNGISCIDLTLNGTNADTFYALSVNVSGYVTATAYTQSIWAQRMAGSFPASSSCAIISRYNITAGGSTDMSYNVPVTNTELARHQSTATTAGVISGSGSFIFIFNNPASTAYSGLTVRIGLPQLEAGAFVTSVIPTTTASATRAIELCSRSYTPGSAITLVSTFTPLGSTIANQSAATLSNGGSTNRIGLYRASSSGNGNAVIIAANVTQTSPTNTGAIAQFARTKMAVAVQAGTARLCMNGGTVNTSAPTDYPTGMNRLGIGDNGTSGSGILNGWIERIDVYEELLSTVQLQVLTT